MAELIIKVEGMGCQGCVTAVEKAVRAVSPDAAVHVDLGGGTVSVADAIVAREVIEAAIARAGYDIVR